MNMTNNKLNIYALTDSHQEARKQCCLFSHIIENAPNNGENTLICDGGDLFKGIYDRELSVCAYLTLRQQLPRAQMVFALGNNDFGFNMDNFNFLQQTAERFNKANIHVICANLKDCQTGETPSWIKPYVVLDINGKKVMVTSFCIHTRLEKFNVTLTDINNEFIAMVPTIKSINPDVFIVLNHSLKESSEMVSSLATAKDVHIDLLLGGHEHSYVAPNVKCHIYYPRAFNENMLKFTLQINEQHNTIESVENINVKDLCLNPLFIASIEEFEKRMGLNVPVAKSTLDLYKSYSDPCPLGTFIADCMRKTAQTDMAMISTGYISKPMPFEKDKILTNYDIECSFSADATMQTVVLSVEELKVVWSNALKYRYVLPTSNARFLQCSQNFAVVCTHEDGHKIGKVAQMYLNGIPLLDAEGNPLLPNQTVSCVIDAFIGSGGQGFEILNMADKQTLEYQNRPVKIKDIFINAIKSAEKEYDSGASYACFKVTDI